MFEDFLLDPNMAYLFLVSGFLLSLLAIITPGTGVLEVGALFALLLAGWGVYNLPINIWGLAVLLIGVFPFIVAVRRSREVIYLVISIIAMVIGSAYIFRGEVWWKPAVNPGLAAVVSLLSAGFFWIIVHKTLEADAEIPHHDLGALIGAIGEAKTDIHLEGSVQALGELWTARSDELIPLSSVVRVTGREGLILDVEVVEE